MTPVSLARAAVLAALLAPVAACAQAPDVRAGMTFQQFETRRLGRVMAADTDGDGRVSRAEFAAAQTGGKGDPAQRFARLDANGDGVVDRAELDTMLRRRFARMDADGDGSVSPAERAALHKRQAPSGDNG